MVLFGKKSGGIYTTVVPLNKVYQVGNTQGVTWSMHSPQWCMFSTYSQMLVQDLFQNESKCLVACAHHSLLFKHASAKAGMYYGFGLSVPIKIEGNITVRKKG